MSIADKITRLQTAKSNIATAITNKGGTVSQGDGFEDFANDIATISGGVTPTGTLSILQNGTYDVTQYASANVNVSGSATEPYIEETFDSSGNLTNAVLHGYTYVRKSAFYSCSNLTSISLPSGITSIEADAFRFCTNLMLASLPNGITELGQTAFAYCYKLAITSLPSSITSIGSSTFANCRGLTSITFEGTPTTISETAFYNCTNLTTINVPWAEGDVANAPWGATNATITYNYTGE